MHQSGGFREIHLFVVRIYTVNLVYAGMANSLLPASYGLLLYRRAETNYPSAFNSEALLGSTARALESPCQSLAN